MLLLEDELTERQLADGAKILGRATLTATGQNLVWMSSITAIRGILERDPDLVSRAYAFIAAEIRVSKGEGIQQDYSFHQHGPCLYSHGYGAGFIVDCSRVAGRVEGTSLAFPPEKIELLTRLILDGTQWFARGAATDFGAEGREITRKGQSTSHLVSAAGYMLRFLPMSALVIAIARLTFGIRVIGFRAILISVGFQESGIVPSLILIGVVVTIIIAVRPTLRRIRLPGTARLSVIMSIGVLVLAAALLLAPWTRSEMLWRVGFFPVIVLGLLAESIAKTMDQNSGLTAVWRTGMTIGIAMLIAGISQISVLREIIDVFDWAPENSMYCPV